MGRLDAQASFRPGLEFGRVAGLETGVNHGRGIRRNVVIHWNSLAADAIPVSGVLRIRAARMDVATANLSPKISGSRVTLSFEGRTGPPPRKVALKIVTDFQA